MEYKIKNKRSQEEMVGFVLIVVLVTIIALVFLAISIRKPQESVESSEISSFAQVMMKYSTSCYSSVERMYDIKDLIKACSNREKCLDGNESCAVLNNTLGEILKESFNIGQENPVKAYNFKAYDSANRTIVRLKEGVCTGARTGTSLLVSSSIKAELEICS